MLIIAGTVRLPAGNLERAKPVMAAMLASSRAEDGCIQFTYAEDVLDPGLIRVFEMWRDQDALDLHFQSEHIKVWRLAWPDLGIHDRQLLAYPATEPTTT
jgi:quinol monooxygenase YgiN